MVSTESNIDRKSLSWATRTAVRPQSASSSLSHFPLPIHFGWGCPFSRTYASWRCGSRLVSGILRRVGDSSTRSTPLPSPELPLPLVTVSPRISSVFVGALNLLPLSGRVSALSDSRLRGVGSARTPLKRGHLSPDLVRCPFFSSVPVAHRPQGIWLQVLIPPPRHHAPVDSHHRAHQTTYDMPAGPSCPY